MKPVIMLIILFAFAACDQVAGEPEADRATLEMEVNEALAVAHLRALVGAQTQAHALAVVDTDRDGSGEYGFVRELSGLKAVREPGQGLKIPLLGQEFKRVGAHGFVEVHGYCFRVFLPGVGGEPVGEGPAQAGDVDVEPAERCWVAYAWPARYGTSGRRTFVVDTRGSVRTAEVPRYSGAGAPEAFDAFAEGEGFNRDFAVEWGEVTSR